MLSLIDRIESVAANHPGRVVFVNGDEFDELTWAELHTDARRIAARMQARGVKPGDNVSLLGPTTRRLVTVIQATWLTGACLVTLPLPMRMGALDQFIQQTRNRVRDADSKMLIIDSQLSAFVEPEEGDPPFVGLDALFDEDTATEDDYQRPKSDPSALAVLQFTSGSTSEPKGVMLTHEAICHNLDGAVEAAGVTSEEVIVSWLPLYHDMGLVGLLSIAMTKGTSLVQGAPQDFLARPLRWMEWISEFGGTGTAGPNFAFALATRALRRTDKELDLSSMRIMLNGAEPIDADTFRKFYDIGEQFGLKRNTAFPAFGMAEVCIAGCFPNPGEELRTDVVDAHRLEVDQIAEPVDQDAHGASEFALLGRPVPGLSIKIVDPETGKERGDREVGELLITGNSLTKGYYKNQAATDELIRDGWLHTGDLAYTVDGELVVCGRIKDLIIVGGRNIYPQDIEKVVGEVEGIRTGNVIAFGVEGRHGAQNIVVVAETRAHDLEALEKQLNREVADVIGVPPKHTVFVQPGTVPKTSSGKLQRSACRAAYLAGELEPINA